MDEIARVYADALFETGEERGNLDELHTELGEFVDALSGNRDLQVFLFSHYFSSQEQREGIRRAVSGASEEFMNFLELLAEKHRMPVIFRIRDRFDELWAQARRRLDVTVTSALKLDDEVLADIKREVERQTDREIRLSNVVDPQILGGLVLRVGNMVLDASLHSKLERLRREVASAA